MNIKILLLLLGYLAWSGGSTYWYVCKIKFLCPDSPSQLKTEVNVSETLTEVKLEPENKDTSIVKAQSKFEESFTIQFQKGSLEYVPNADLEVFLTKMAKFIIENPNKKLQIFGHTDNMGAEDKNYTLGLGRAETVKNRLCFYGVSEKAIISNSFGETKPLQDNSTIEGRNANRRIDFKFNP